MELEIMNYRLENGRIILMLQLLNNFLDCIRSPRSFSDLHILWKISLYIYRLGRMVPKAIKRRNKKNYQIKNIFLVS